MSKNLSEKRLAMGEQAWSEYQRIRKNNKANSYKNKNSRKVVEWRRRVKIKLIEYKGGKCENCGYDKPYPSCYDFHHINAEEKEFSISGKSISFERLKAEVDKCKLLCRNCHGELHDIEFTIRREETIKRIDSHVAQ